MRLGTFPPLRAITQMYRASRHEYQEVTDDHAQRRSSHAPVSGRFSPVARRAVCALPGSAVRHFRRRLAGKDRAEDLAQEAWLAVLRSVERYQPRALFRTYLYGIALKLLAGERRRTAKEHAAISLTQAAAPELPESDHWVREALAKLDATERES